MCCEEKLENQLKVIRSEYKEQYYSHHVSKLSDSSIVESQSTSFVDASNNTSDKAEVADSNNNIILVNSEKQIHQIFISQKVKKVKKKTVLIVGDSIVNGIEESNLSQTRHIRVQTLSGAKIEDLKVLEKVLLHVETNNALSDSPEDIFSKLISSVDSINCSLPKCNIIISDLSDIIITVYWKIVILKKSTRQNVVLI